MQGGNRTDSTNVNRIFVQGEAYGYINSCGRRRRSEASAIEFWFEFGSNYSYLSVMRIETEAHKHGVRIVWKPFLLGPILQSLGAHPFSQNEKGAHIQKDMTRLCRKYGLAPWVKPSVFPRLSVLPLRIVLSAAEEPWIPAFCRVNRRGF
jgi:2-hydroxychromene-2-carboxylate isomerase